MLSLFSYQSLILTISLSELCLVLGRAFLLELPDLRALLGSKLLAQDSLHLLVDIMCCLHIIYDLLLLHLDLLLPHSLIKFSFFCCFYDLTLELNLLFQACYVLPEDAFALVGLELVLLCQYLLDPALLIVIRS